MNSHPPQAPLHLRDRTRCDAERHARAPRPELDVLAALDGLSSVSTAAAHVLRTCADERSSAADMGRALATDAPLAARVLRASNSVYYGMSGRVADLGRAVTVVGFRCVHALAVTAAAGADDDHPPGWWEQCTKTAAAAGLLARAMRVPESEAFAAGLLQDVGQALLHRYDPTVAATAAALVPTEPHLRRDPLVTERGSYGVDHVQVGARLMGRCSFPPSLVQAVGEHHSPQPTTPLGRVLRVATALVIDGADTERVIHLSGGVLSAADLLRLRPAVQERAAQVASALSAG